MNCTIVRPQFTKSTESFADRITHKILFGTIICMLALGISPAIYGQAAGSFLGNVLDKSGSSVVGASVTVINQGTGLERNAKTDDTGHYLVPLLPVGIFTVRVEAPGFQTAESKNLNLQVAEARELDFSLVPAGVTATVTVAGEAVAIETANPSLGQVITSQQVSQLPLNGRDFVQLATLTAGATAETNTGSFFTSAPASEVAARGSFSLSVGGSRPNSTDWLLDGVDNNELTAGGIGVYSSIDDIAEFKVLTYTYSAEFGTRAGPTVLVTTKSGTNNFHGSAYEFVRNTDLDARGGFATTTPKFNLNQFGGSVGGPIRKNKTFFFVDGEQKYQREGIVFTGKIPTQEMIGGDFSADPWGTAQSGIVVSNPFTNAPFQCGGSPCNIIPSTLFSSIGQGLLALYPKVDPLVPSEAPVGNSGLGYNYVTEPVRSLNETKFDIRVDQTITDKDTAFARFSYDQAFTYDPGGAPPPSLAEANPFGSNETLVNHARNIGIGETHVFSPRTLNLATFGYDRIFDYIASQDNFTCASALLGIPNADLGCSSVGTKLPGGQYSQGMVSVDMYGGYWSLGDRGYSPFQGGTNIFSFKDDLDLIRGKHDIHTGIDLRANQMNVGTEAFQDGFLLIGNEGFFSGSPESDLLLGLAGGAIHDQSFYGPVTGRRWKIVRPFVEDDWRVLPSLTLNLGLAWDLTSPITEIHDRMADYIPSEDPNVGGQLLIAGQNGVSRSAGVNRYWGGYEPRVGLAWKVLGSDKTVVRAGFGIYHDSAWSMGAQGLWQNPPNLGESDNFDGPVMLSGGFGAIPAPQDINSCVSDPNCFTGSFNWQSQNFQPGRVHQYNVNVERELPGNVLVTAGYAGSTGGHLLLYGNDLNTQSPSACGTVGGYTIGCKPDGSAYTPPYESNTPDDNAIFTMSDLGKTRYNSLQVKAETKTAKHGLYALVAYTYSRTYDNGLSDGLGSVLSAPYFPLPNWENLDWSLSQINLDNSFTGSVIYDLPFGKGRMFGGGWNTATDTLLGGWQVTLIERLSSGFPVPLIDSNNGASGQGFNAFENGGNDNNYNRPNQVANCNAYSADHSKYQWINPACFQVSAAGELGNAARVPVTGPDFVNSDFSLIKQFPLHREMGLNFRAEFFNLFNHPQYGLPGNDISVATVDSNGVIVPNGSNGFGAVSSTVNNPRLIQLALKLTF